MLPQALRKRKRLLTNEKRLKKRRVGSVPSVSCIIALFVAANTAHYFKDDPRLDSAGRPAPMI